MNNKNLILPIIIGVAVVVILGAGGYWYFQSVQSTKAPVVVLPKTTTPSLANQPETTAPALSSNQLANSTQTPTANTSTPSPTGTNSALTTPTNTPSISISAYKDGRYNATGGYISPGGAQSLDLTTTIKDGKIADIQMVSKATDAKSERYQNIFKEGVSGIIVGKSLDDNLDPGTVNGSSLTHKGFVQAMESIKTQASN